MRIDFQEELDALESGGNLRKIRTVETRGKYLIYKGKNYLNLSSNDYLGLSQTVLQAEFLETVDFGANFLMSNPSSRLITGNSAEYDQLEKSLGRLYGERSVLVLGSGYHVNIGVLPAVTSKEDLILCDKLVHASLIDGLRLCEAKWIRFRHNDVAHLEQLLVENRGKYRNVWVVTESLFSMGGDFAPLGEIVALKKLFGFRIYLDEAHAFGVRGEGGAGYAQEVGVLEDVDILIATLGKALCSAGAFVVCDEVVRKVLINRMRSLIFSTALPPISLLWSDFLVRKLSGLNSERKHLQELARMFGEGSSHIIPIVVGDNNRALEVAEKMRRAGYWTTAIRHPTVPRGGEMIRVSLNAGLSVGDVEGFKVVADNILYR